ncbi:MAG: 4-hydroxy-tetrahydrodipicolinate synthase [Marinilabiliales bacterium]|nr:4-hydroxy-tetrahydrodipicolinate synthase [Marinilabiliales bacterium]
MHKIFQGAGVALITPFLENLAIDFESLGKIIDYQIDNRMDFLVVLGTTAETATLSKSEKQAIIDFACNKAANKVPVMVGIGGNSTSEVVDDITHLDLSQVQGILSVVPYYNKPSQEGIYQHFKAIAAAAPVPVFLYNVPGRTAVHMSAETTLRLANDCSNIIGTKEASGNFADIMRILKDKPDHFSLLTGDDSLIVPTSALGGEGVISVIANTLPELLSNVTHNSLKGNFVQAASQQLAMQSLVEDLFAEGNPAGVKASLHSHGMCRNVLRLPLVPVSDPLYGRIAEKTKQLL